MLLEESNKLAKILVNALRRKLEEQGHLATNNLRNSIEIEVKQEFDAVVLEETHLKYGDYVNTGRAPGKKGVPIQALKQWIEVKGIATGKKALSIAFAIQKTIIREGIPTRKRRSEGKKTAWIDDTLQENDRLIAETIFKAAGEEMDVLINQITLKAFRQ